MDLTHSNRDSGFMVIDPFGTTLKGIGLGNYPICVDKGLYRLVELDGTKPRTLVKKKKEKKKRNRAK